MQTLQQQRAAHALKGVQDLIALNDGDKLKARASELPFMIQANGLGQAAAFFCSKKDKDGYDKIYREGKKVLMNLLDIEVPLIAALNGPVLLHSEYALLADIVLATPETVFQDKPHFDFGIAPGDGVNLLWPEVIGSVRGRYFLLTRQRLDAQTAKEWGAVNEVVPADHLLARAHEIAEGLAKLPPLTSRYTRIALTQKLRRIIDEGVGYGLALEGISAAEVARSMNQTA